AGCDTEVRALEPVVMPHLRQIPMDAALVSKFDRIIVGNSGRFQVGNRVTDLPKNALRTPLPGVNLGLQLVATPRTNNF
ncbi:MAG: GntR family transcriptional regulator, partial [Microbacteriaceae bacterium]|nr:GntR family transcriptional regulator [Microbacteriaceae bacterium]